MHWWCFSKNWINKKWDLWLSESWGSSPRGTFFLLHIFTISNIRFKLHVGKRCFRRVPKTWLIHVQKYNNQTSIIRNKFNSDQQFYFSCDPASLRNREKAQKLRQQEKLDFKHEWKMQRTWIGADSELAYAARKILNGFDSRLINWARMFIFWWPRNSVQVIRVAT